MDEKMEENLDELYSECCQKMLFLQKIEQKK
jgi:hypothetical protein